MHFYKQHNLNTSFGVWSDYGNARSYFSKSEGPQVMLLAATKCIGMHGLQIH